MPLIVLTGLLFPLTVLAGPFDDGVTAYNAKDYEGALALYRKAANDGHIKYQHNMGHLYENGLGVEQSYEQAASWYSKAAAQGF